MRVKMEGGGTPNGVERDNCTGWVKIIINDSTINAAVSINAVVHYNNKNTWTGPV